MAPPDTPFPTSDRGTGTGTCGMGVPEEERDLEKLVMDLSPVGIPTTSQTFALRVEGDSAVGGGISAGDVVILEKRRPRPGEIVAVVVETGLRLMRCVVEHGKPLLRTENPGDRDIPLSGKSLVQGVAVGLIRRL